MKARGSRRGEKAEGVGRGEREEERWERQMGSGEKGRGETNGNKGKRGDPIGFVRGDGRAGEG